jgi:phage baseplate assembly protein gpV/uncharacterized Zn-binding protein involved in type VI secretion
MEILLKKYPDPRKGVTGALEFQRKKYAEACPPRLGIVVDNKDPDCLGRVKVACDMIAPGAITPWIPLVQGWAMDGQGWWQLPDIGTQVLLVFPGGSMRFPLVLGSLWDENHKPPVTTTEKAADAVLYQTKNHRLEIIDESGKETIMIHTSEGKIRMSLTKDKGIELINELGDINIECKKLTVESEKDLQIQAEKKLTIEAGEDAAYTAKKTIKVTSDKEVKCKGKNIKLEGSKGVATGGKQLAKQDDKVMGFDIHKMRIPSGDGTKVVPLPHPFIGKMNDKLSKDVKIAGKNAATKGSMAKHDSGNHMQLPGTIKFEKGCKKTGEVTGGTAPKVKINGKEAATIGSTVTTCNDMGMKENSMILAVGASMPMPAIINPKNTEEYEAEREKAKTKKPQFTTVKWGKTSAKEGEELELSAQVKDIEDGNMVTLQVWKDGQDPAVHVPEAQIATNVDGGVAKGMWGYQRKNGEPMPENGLKFFFTAHSAWCPMKESNTLTIEQKKPEFSSLKWEFIEVDENGKEKSRKDASEFTYGTDASVSVKVKNMEAGEYVSFFVYEEGRESESEQLCITQGEVKDGSVSAIWNVRVPGERLEELKESDELKFVFVPAAADGRAKGEKGPSAQAVFVASIKMIVDPDDLSNDGKYTLESTNGSYKKSVAVKDGKKKANSAFELLFEQVKPGLEYTLKFENPGEGKSQFVFEKKPFLNLVRK